ncbi:dTDP-4-amino-4,6-dideoxygalactose transaminase [Hyunsoonleella aestuarii]|uniref:dTDP-4-amino-4,6-dideoxygalactose transaminase n=1 Tax=Hyunsoonleella aestuarii TaxID=912802 RepID=A0ABP8E717_9FLAO|nr:dTDP-4-amino-4,6-dideoxygalactose transaminase [Hyunsoonleella aestuarii]
MKIPFNKPFLTGKETFYINDAVNSGKISGNGKYTKLCHSFFEKKYEFKKCFLTTSCTDALEMAAILLDIQPGDEVILPSFTFVSTANAFVLRGAKLVFADSSNQNPNIDASKIESLITKNTKVIVVVHYAGMACEMDEIMDIANQYNLFVVEDAAQAIDSFYKGKPLGSIGHLGAFSFHETKNITSGEGGMLTINDEKFIERAEIIWEKGTNRSAFFRGEINKYNWVDIGSSFLPSEVVSAFLYAQLECLDDLQKKRKKIWSKYFEAFNLNQNKTFELPYIPHYATNNAHMFYVNFKTVKERDELIQILKKNQILAVFHYIPLHSSPFYFNKHDRRILANCDRFSDCLVRLPLYNDLKKKEQSKIINIVNEL